MAILLPEQASLGMGSSSIVPRETFAGMKDPGNKGAGLMSLSKALAQLGSTFEDIEAKRKAEAEKAAMDTVYWDATTGMEGAGMDGATSNETGLFGGGSGGLFGNLFGGGSVGGTKPERGDINNFNSRTHSRVQARYRAIQGERGTLDWLGGEGYLNDENIPANVRDDPRQMEAYLHAGRKRIIQMYQNDHVAGSAALKTYDDEADKLRTRMGTQRAKEFEENEKESYTRGLGGSGDSFSSAADDPADVPMLREEAPATNRYRTRGRPVVPELEKAIREVAGNTWMAEYMIAAARVESSGGRNLANPNSSARGPFQFIKSTARQYGLRNPMDFRQSAKGMAKLTTDIHKGLSKALGREPSFAELYLGHQQGLGGAIKLLSNPNKRAVDIVGKEAVRLNGGKANMTAREFAGLWLNKFNKKNGIDMGVRAGRLAAGGDGSEITMAGMAGENVFSGADVESLAGSTDLTGKIEPYTGPGADATGLEIASTRETIAAIPQEEAYPGDENEGKYDYEVQGGEKYVNEKGEEVVYVPDDPWVLSERRKLLQHDAEFGRNSTLSKRERRDLAYEFYYNKAMETKDTKALDVMPPEWLTPEQRAKVVALRDKMNETKSEDYLRKMRVQATERDERVRLKKSSLIEKRQKGEEIDPFTEARDEDGTLNQQLFDFARELTNVETVPARDSSKERARITSAVLSSSVTGNWKELGMEGPPTDQQLIDYIHGNTNMNPDDKAALLQQVSTLQEGANIMDGEMVNDYFTNNVGLTTKNLRTGYFDTKDQASIAAFSGLERSVRKYYEARVKERLLEFMQPGPNGEPPSIPRGSALRQIVREADEETNKWLIEKALPASQAAMTGANTGKTLNAQGDAVATDPALLDLSAQPKPDPRAGLVRTVDENGVIRYERKQQ